MRTKSLRQFAVLLGVLGVLALAVAVLYFALPAGKLPSILGRIPNGTRHRTKRAEAAIAFGVILVAGSVVAFVQARRRHRNRH